jgi:hypothetical protein
LAQFGDKTGPVIEDVAKFVHEVILAQRTPAHHLPDRVGDFAGLTKKTQRAIDQPLVARLARRTITRRSLAIFIDRHCRLQGEIQG